MKTQDTLLDMPVSRVAGSGVFAASESEVEYASTQAALSIPPLWPLASSVAVNPFLGQSGEPLSQTATRLARVGGIRITPSREYFRGLLTEGIILDADLAAALADPVGLKAQGLTSPADLRVAAAQDTDPPESLPTVADLAARHTGTDWPTLLAQRFGAWAAGYFDEGQAIWVAPRGRGAYSAWRAVATHDLTLEIVGLTGFARHVAEAPETATGMRARAIATLGLDTPALETYLHSLLFRLQGWAQYARYQAWQADLVGSTDTTLTDFLAIALLQEEALYLHTRDAIDTDWQAVIAEHAKPLIPDHDQLVDTLLQDALERASQRQLRSQLLGHIQSDSMGSSAVISESTEAVFDVPRWDLHRPSLQAAFCIDVRSEVFRRSLESVDSGITTLGFAGFFGIATAHRRFASDVTEHRLPVLLNPGLYSTASAPQAQEADRAARISARVSRAWRRFKLAAVSSFSFVDAAGPIYVVKLLRDTLGLSRQDDVDKQPPQLDPMPCLVSRVAMARQVLGAMSLTDVFAPVVLLLGHGARVTNNAHASSLQCGACGGYSGDVNARLLASLLNDDDVRQKLSESGGPTIPEDTRFLAGLHDTTSDSVRLFADDCQSEVPVHRLEQVERWLESAGCMTRTKRALRLPRAGSESAIAARCQNWAEVRPEWALAGCRAFIAAPRTRTRGMELSGQAFLHEYRWQQDEGFAILELIMTAPVVVASWISLQYYGSLVAPDAFGAGNKLLHNVTGGIGVVEGNGGALRGGLPWQSVHDGEQAIHQPLRLSVCIEAPTQALNDILERHSKVRELFDNRWLSLLALDSDGQHAWRYDGNLRWTVA